jgi:hypothetical protein
VEGNKMIFLIAIIAAAYLVIGYKLIRPYRTANNILGTSFGLFFGVILHALWLPALIVFIVMVRKEGWGGWI